MELSNNLLVNLGQKNIKPIYVLQIEDVPYLIGSDTIKKYLRYGDDLYEYGDEGLYYGGLVPYPDQKTLISLDGTTTSIKQNLEPDKARGSGVSQLTIRLIDKNLDATKLLSGLYGEILFKKVKVWVGFGETSAWNEDFILIFRGIIESVDAGQGHVNLNLNSPDQKKRQLLLPKADTELDGAINNSQVAITLASVENLFVVPDHPAYAPKDDSIKTYVRIEDEIIEYTSISGLVLNGCVRGSLGTTAVAHDDESAVESFYVLEGNAMDLALKLMLSDADQTPYLSSFEATSVGITDSEAIDDIIWFAGKNITRDYNITIGDFITTSGFTEAGNNFATYKEILDVVVTDTGSYIMVDETLTLEVGATGSVTFLSQYNTLGFGLKMDTDEVDIDKHEELRRSFLSIHNYRFYLRQEIEEGKEFIEKEIYLPASCYSLPGDREGLSRVGVGIHKAPIPGRGIVTLSEDNITNPKDLKVKRSINKNHYNAIVFRYEDTPLDEKLLRTNVATAGTITVPTGNKALVIDSLGLKDFLLAKNISTAAGDRLLERYRNAAEFLDDVKIQFKDAVKINIGDVVILDPTDLNLINTLELSRDKPAGLWEVINKDTDTKTGAVKLSLVDTSFNIEARFGLISPASKLTEVITQTRFKISYIYGPSRFGESEYKKWTNLRNCFVKIRRPDYSFEHTTRLTKVSPSGMEIETLPSFTIQTDDIMEFSNYSDSRDEEKLIFVFLTDGTNDFPDGGKPYVHL